MTARQCWLPGAALVALAAGLYLFKSDLQSNLPVAAVPESTRTTAKAEVETSAPAVATVQPQKLKSRETASVDKPLRELTPSKEQLKQEVERDPHETPQALLRFSVNLYEKQTAAATEEKAKSFFNELETCALGQEQKGQHSIQALCLLNAKRLIKTYPILATDYQRLEQLADPQALVILKDMAL